MRIKRRWLKLKTIAECKIACQHPNHENQIMTCWKNEQKMAFYSFYWLTIRQINKKIDKKYKLYTY